MNEQKMVLGKNMTSYGENETVNVFNSEKDGKKKKEQFIDQLIIKGESKC